MIESRRVEPSAWLLPKKGQRRLEYVCSWMMGPKYLRDRFDQIWLAARPGIRLSATKSAASSTRLAVIGRKT